jgi:hypothetical protein
MKLIITLVLTLIVTNVHATLEDGNSFLESYEQKNPNAKQYLLGYVAGMYDSFERTEPALATCIGSEVRMSQIMDSIAIYLKNNPQIRHLPIYYIYSDALKKQFKC